MPRIAPQVKAKLSEARRTQILDAATRVFARRGFDRATIKDVARAARLSEGSIYNYFRSKEELLIHIPGHVAQPVLLPLAGTLTLDTAEDVERALMTLAGRMVARVQEQAPFLKVFLSALPHLSPAARERYMALFPMYAAGILEQFLREGMRRGVFRSDLDVEIAARALPGMLLLFLMAQEVLLERRMIARDYDSIVKEAVRLFLYGAAPRAPVVAAGQTLRRRTT